ncbi:protein-glutamate O-methyltransferase CheR [Legionella sp. km772]|uniref:CheR family methyltransferase n=1 Tax=Legionella sp. km772 TaxID=2498111 RepID=UPI000F8F6CD5|nr:protein-glutamate O-methyltransferase CheR [Legionella sp. km772]RUR04279.1 protein-glutamate O-methyltransferase CheR [Legionella sp. km772]
MRDFNNLDQISNESFYHFIKLIHQLTGIKIDKTRQSMLISRLRKRVLSLNLSTYEDYYHFINSNSQEKEIFIESITTHETYCYRTPRIWNFLIDTLIPTWIAKNKGNTFRAWSAAASSGEEAHTLGAILQHFKDQQCSSSFQYSILGTDISQKMIHRCNEGLYSGRSIERFKQEKPDLFFKYFNKRTEHYGVIPDIKQRLNFKQHNLFNFLNSPQLFDLILLRNVLIYFTPEDQKKVLDLINKKMTPDGILIIGESETLNNLNTDFCFIDTLIYSCYAHKLVV